MLVDDELYEQVLAIVCRVLQRGSLDPRLDFFDLGASSLAILQIGELLTDECGVSVSVTDIFDAPDVDSFARFVTRARAGASPAAD